MKKKQDKIVKIAGKFIELIENNNRKIEPEKY